jgi:hypothetical protein
MNEACFIVKDSGAEHLGKIALGVHTSWLLDERSTFI